MVPKQDQNSITFGTFKPDDDLFIGGCGWDAMNKREFHHTKDRFQPSLVTISSAVSEKLLWVFPNGRTTHHPTNSPELFQVGKTKYGIWDVGGSNPVWVRPDFQKGVCCCVAWKYFPFLCEPWETQENHSVWLSSPRCCVQVVFFLEVWVQIPILKWISCVFSGENTVWCGFNKVWNIIHDF